MDDLHFSMRTPEHPPCLGHKGGCATCCSAYDKAMLAEALWRKKAKALNLSLSEGKGHSAAQGDPFTGVHIDTYMGRFSMLADKLAAMRSTFAALVNAEHSTPRFLAQARGKAAHYRCAVQLLAAALTQTIHPAESAHCLPAPGPEEEASDSLFDWDQTIRLSTRTRAALALLLKVTDELRDAGQPMDGPPIQACPVTCSHAGYGGPDGPTCRLTATPSTLSDLGNLHPLRQHCPRPGARLMPRPSLAGHCNAVPTTPATSRAEPLGPHGLVYTGPEGPGPRSGRCRRTRPVRLRPEPGLRSVLFCGSRGGRRSNGRIHAAQLGRVAMSWLSAAAPGLRSTISTHAPRPGGRQLGLP